MTDALSWEKTTCLSNLPAAGGERRLAWATIAASAAIFVVLAPFAKAPLGVLPAFIPVYQSALVVNDAITVVFLLGLRHSSRSDALSLLAGGYLFTALMSILHALSFPGLFAPTGLLDAGPQTTAWLYIFWHSGFPLFVIAYVGCSAAARPSWGNASDLALGVGSALVLVCGLTLLATLGRRLLPDVMQGSDYTPAMIVVVSSVWLLNLAALLVLSRRKPYSVLDLWLIVTMSAWLFDIALSAGLNSGRYDLGFYAGRIYGLLAASFVLISLLTQHGRLYVQLVKLRASDREKTEELRRLTAVDPLTGIANRRAFEEALDREWRRMLRHSTPLSLLMMDVDYFKRFNDSYGHVAGDQCLRVVAQAVASRARRAGELAARYGGEEFAVLAPQTDIAAARRLAELICGTVRERQIPHDGSAVAPYVTMSVGVACISELPDSAAALSRNNSPRDSSRGVATVLIEAADHALYEAKLAGRNRVVAVGEDEAAAATPAAART
jgi:diguanylate cyclase (GGDEF)-like protein